MTHTEEDIASNAMNLLSATSTWILVRHQWLITKMRSILTGEASPALSDLYQFDALQLNYSKLPESLYISFTSTKQRLENVWDATVNSYHPLSGLSISDQLNLFQMQAHLFMQESKELNQQLWGDFTMRDPLTGALTRLTLKSCLLQEFTRSTRHQHPCTIAIVDQDKFKKINDQWGHSTGDMVLINTASTIQKNLRYGDKLFRYGGDEWLILMPNTDHEKATFMLERIQKISSEFRYTTDNDSQFYSSFHYGIAECSQHDSVDEWIANADKNLYQAKKTNEMTLFN